MSGNLARPAVRTEAGSAPDGKETNPPLPAHGRLGYIPSLDGFRAIAIVIVLLSHVGLERWVPGQFGVTLFFFLSGYLITTLLRDEFLRSGKISFRGFYLRRATRILPPMWLAIGLAVIFSAVGWNLPLNTRWLPMDFVFLSNYYPYSSVPIGLWSLSVEEHFYLIFPMLAALTFARGKWWTLLAICVCACVLVLGIRMAEIARGTTPEALIFLTHTRLDSILFGAILALWNNPVIDPGNRLPSVWPSYVIGGLILLAGFVFRDDYFRFTSRFTLQGIALILIFNAAIRDRGFVHRLLENPVLRFIAALSYSVYLLHGIFVEAFAPLADTIGHFGAALLAFAVTFACAYGSLILVERPLGEWRRGIERNWKSSSGDCAAKSAPGQLG